MFRLILSIGNGYFPEQHEVVGLCNSKCIYFKSDTNSVQLMAVQLVKTLHAFWEFLSSNSVITRISSLDLS